MASAIPLFYRVVFMWLDPFIAGAGGLLQFLDPVTSITGFVANPPVIDPAYLPIFEQNGAGALNVAFSTAVVTRVTSDLSVWKALQGGILIMDFATGYTIWKSLAQQGRLELSALRAEDWQWISGIVFLGLTRLAFVFGFGLGSSGVAATKKRL